MNNDVFVGPHQFQQLLKIAIVKLLFDSEQLDGNYEVVCFLLGNSPASEFYVSAFQFTVCPSSQADRHEERLGLRNVRVHIREKVWLENSLSQTFSRINTPTFSNLVILHTYPPMKMGRAVCSEMPAHKIQTPGNYPEESIQHSERGESLNQE